MTDVLIGAVWTLIAMLAGGMLTLVLVAVLGDRGDEGPGEETPVPFDPDLEWWLVEHTITEPFEANLLVDADA